MFQALHKYYDDCFDNGEFNIEKVSSEIIRDYKYNGEERARLLKSTYELVLNAKFMNSFTKEYLTHSNRNYDDIVNEYNEINDSNLDLNSGRSRITFCQRRIADIFKCIRYDNKDLNFLTWLMYGKAHMGIEDSEEKKELRDKFIKQYMLFNDLYGSVIEIEKKDMLIKLPTCKKVSSLSEDKFNDFMEVIEPYSRFRLSVVQKAINEMTEEVGYLRYLMSRTSKLSEEDIERRNTILRWLGKDTISSEIELENKENKEDIEVIDNIGDIFKQ